MYMGWHKQGELLLCYLHLVDLFKTATSNTDEKWSLIFTLLSRHFDRDAVAECSFAFACCVHFILDAAVDDPELYLRPRNRIN